MINFLQRILIALFLLLTLQVSNIWMVTAEEDFEIESYELNNDEQESTPVHAKIINETESIQPGLPFSLAIKLNIDKNWHTYWKNPGDSGMAPLIEWKLPDGFTLNSVHWQAPSRLTHDSSVGFGYENEMFFLVDLTASQTISENATIDIEASITWLACSDMMCLPGNSEVSTQLLIKNEKPKSDANHDFEKLRTGLPSKTWGLEALSRNKEFIELKVKAPKDHSTLYTKAYFCPEDVGFVDHKTVTSFDPESISLNDHYKVSLKRQDSKNSGQENLKGILVLTSENETKKEFVAVDLAIKEDPFHDDELSSSHEIASLGKVETKGLKFVDTDEVQQSELEGHFGKALLFAFIGGMLLNLMPCVLPVLSLKIFSFVKMSGESRKLCFQHGIAFSVGVLISFWALAGSLLILQAYGQSVGWGFQLQEPIFVGVLAAIIFMLGLNLFGVMEIGAGITSAVGNINHKRTGLTSSFFSGILATAIATPCTGPFLGSAVGYAVTLPAILALAIFTVLGFGMAFPYLLLSAYPSLLRFIPKPGHWMVTFKEIMGFLMMATTIWLLWVFSAQTSTSSLILLIGALFFLGISCWIYGKWGSPLQKKLSRRISFAFSLAFLMLAAFTINSATGSSITEQRTSEESEIASLWEPFSPERIVELQKQGIAVFVDFTAKWCLICQTNHMSLSTDGAEAKFQSAGVVRMKADWTRKDSVITEELKKFGRSSVPLYVLYGTNESEKPKILPQVLTSDIVVEYLNEL